MELEMDIESYFRNKGSSPGLTKVEALILGIPFPLRTGWLRRHGSRAITSDQEQMLTRMPLRRRARMQTAPANAAVNQLNLFERHLR
jgi:hypothetical protein